MTRQAASKKDLIETRSNSLLSTSIGGNPLLDEIMEADHGQDYKQPDLPKYHNANGDHVTHGNILNLCYFCTRVTMHYFASYSR